MLDLVSDCSTNKRTKLAKGNIRYYIETAASVCFYIFIPYRLPEFSILSKSFAYIYIYIYICTTIVWSGTKCNTGLYRLGTYLDHGTKYSTMVWLSTNYNPIAWSSTKCDTMFWGRLPFVTLSFGNGTKCNNILARHHSENFIGKWVLRSQ